MTKIVAIINKIDPDYTVTDLKAEIYTVGMSIAAAAFLVLSSILYFA